MKWQEMRVSLSLLSLRIESRFEIPDSNSFDNLTSPLYPGDPGIPGGPGKPGTPGVPMTPISPLEPRRQIQVNKVKHCCCRGDFR